MSVLSGCTGKPVSDPATGSWAKEMTDDYSGEEATDPDWGQSNTLSRRAVLLSCGCFGIGPDAGAGHRHDAGEAAAARAAAEELGALLAEVGVGVVAA
jgi:hypothetical protein